MYKQKFNSLSSSLFSQHARVEWILEHCTWITSRIKNIKSKLTEHQFQQQPGKFHCGQSRAISPENDQWWIIKDCTLPMLMIDSPHSPHPNWWFWSSSVYANPTISQQRHQQKWPSSNLIESDKGTNFFNMKPKIRTVFREGDAGDGSSVSREVSNICPLLQIPNLHNSILRSSTEDQTIRMELSAHQCWKGHEHW